MADASHTAVCKVPASKRKPAWPGEGEGAGETDSLKLQLPNLHRHSWEGSAFHGVNHLLICSFINLSARHLMD